MAKKALPHLIFPLKTSVLKILNLRKRENLILQLNKRLKVIRWDWKRMSPSRIQLKSKVAAVVAVTLTFGSRKTKSQWSNLPPHLHNLTRPKSLIRLKSMSKISYPSQHIIIKWTPKTARSFNSTIQSLKSSTNLNWRSWDSKIRSSSFPYSPSTHHPSKWCKRLFKKGSTRWERSLLRIPLTNSWRPR